MTQLRQLTWVGEVFSKRFRENWCTVYVTVSTVNCEKREASG